METKIPDLISLESLNASKVQLTIEDMTENPTAPEQPDTAQATDESEDNEKVLEAPNTATV